jgi:hypothetical protein
MATDAQQQTVGARGIGFQLSAEGNTVIVYAGSAELHLVPKHKRKACGNQVEPEAAAMAERYGADTALPGWRGRLVCSRCGSCNVDIVVTGTERR